MSNTKAAVDRRKGPVRPKSEIANLHISEPFNFRHDFHVPPEDVDARSVDGNRSLSPPPPCPGSKDGSSAELSIPDEAQHEALLQLLKGEIIPALHIEIGDIIEKKLQKVLDQLLPAIKEGNRHCSRCTRPLSDPISYSTLESHPASKYVNVPKAHQSVTNTYVIEPNTPGTSTQRLNRNPDDTESGEQLANGRPVCNPMYPISGGDTLYLPVHTKAGTIVKYGSEIHLVPAQTATQSQQNHSLQRSNTMPIGQGPHIANGHQRLSGRSGMSRDKPDERECLAKALQMNVIELVNDVIFKDSELPDVLLADGCLTENESVRCRKYPDPRDQVRLLLCIIKGRDLDVLKRFLKHIKSHNESVAQTIEDQFEQNKKQGIRSNTCALCKLAERVDLKYIADSLYKHSLVDDGLYNIMFQTALPTGAQGEIWHKVIACLNAKCAENASAVKSIMTEALAHKNHYNQLAKEIQWMISNQHELSCRCEVRFILPRAGDSILSVVSSRSPPTSTSDVYEVAKSDHAHGIDETDEEAKTPVQKDSEQSVADGSRSMTSTDVSVELKDDDTLTPKNTTEMVFEEVEIPAPKPNTESKQVGHPDYVRLADTTNRQTNKPRARNNATSDVIPSNANEQVEKKVSNDVHEAAMTTQHTPRNKPEVQRRTILIPSDLQSSNV